MLHQKRVIVASRNFIITLSCLYVGINQGIAQTVLTEVYNIQKIESPEFTQVAPNSSPTVIGFNDLGQVIGNVYNNQSREYHSFVWKPFKNADGSDDSSLTFLKEVVPPTSLLSPIYSTNSIKASSINNQGIVTGSFDTVSNFGTWSCPALWDANDGHSIPLQQPPNSWVFWSGGADKINDIGTIVGRGAYPVGYQGAVWKVNYGTDGHAVDASFVRSPYGFGNFDRGLSDLNNNDEGTGNYDIYPPHISWKAKNIRNSQSIIIGDEYTEMSYPDSTNVYSAGITTKGEVAGTIQLFPSVRTGFNDSGYRVILWNSNNVGTIVTQGSCVGISNSGSIIGHHEGASGTTGITENDWFPFIWDKTKGIRRVVLDDPRWQIISLIKINNVGQILAYALKDGQYPERPILLTSSSLSGSEIQLLTTDDPTKPAHEVAGIVCDNLSGMNPALRNKITVKLPPQHSNATISVVPIGTNPGTVVVRQGEFDYYPPDEYNENPTPLNVDDLTKPAVRKITLAIRIEDPDPADGNKVAYKDIILARPPVILVHGINSGPSRWNKFMSDIHAKEIRMPFARVDHSDILGLNGNDPVELAALRVAKTLEDTLKAVRTGEVIPVSDAERKVAYYDVNGVPVYEIVFYDFSDYISPDKLGLAIRRADVVAWSYGGVATRWYIASKGANSPQSASWYQLPKMTDTSAFSTINYAERNDIRKFITMGSMWRGVPFCNESNEARLRSNPPKDTDLWNAPIKTSIKDYLNITRPDLLGEVSSNLKFGGTILNGSSIEVMAVSSPWINYLLYGSNSISNDTIAKPFNENIAYSSVSGDDNNYPVKKLLDISIVNIDLMKWFDDLQSLSWFSYLRLETLSTSSSRNINDGIVPVWSSMLPGDGTTFFVNHDHSSYPDYSDVQEFIIKKFNDVRMAENTGNNLNQYWNNLENLSTTNYTWNFRKGAIAPIYQEQIYKNINGIGRLNPKSIQENRPDLLKVEKTDTTATFKWTTLLRTTGKIQFYNTPYQTEIADSPKTTPLGTSHSVTISGLTPSTDYVYKITNTLPNTPGEPIELKFHEGQKDGVLRLTTNPIDHPILEFSADRSTYTQSPNFLGCDFIVKNTGYGTAVDFQITGIDLKGASGDFGFSTPRKISINASQSQRISITINRNDTKSIFTLNMSIRYSYKNANGSLITGNSLWVRVK
jgi:pimeloyl-ACP methyl ester carboxylesterase